MTPPTQEQLEFNIALRAQYGEAMADRAEQFSWLTLCMLALATDELSDDERCKTYTRASEHLDKLIRSLMPAGDIARMVECAHRLDAALEQWRLDEIEARDGLPPAR